MNQELREMFVADQADRTDHPMELVSRRMAERSFPSVLFCEGTSHFIAPQ